MIYVHAALDAIALTYCLYVFYAAGMNIKRVSQSGKLTLVGKLLGYPTLLIGVVLDVVVNVLVMTVVLLELPREWTVSGRLERHKDSLGWRSAVAKFIEPVLDPLDPSGDHI